MVTLDTGGVHLLPLADMNLIQLRNLAMVLLGASNVRVLSAGEDKPGRAKPEATDPEKIVVVPKPDPAVPAETKADEP